MKVCLDTNVFIAVKNKEDASDYCERILDAIDDGKVKGTVSTIVVAEVLVGFYQNGEYREAEKFLAHIMQRYEVVPVNAEIASKAAKLRAEQGVKLPDAIVVATALRADCLVTMDDELLKKSGDVTVLNPEEFCKRFL